MSKLTKFAWISNVHKTYAFKPPCFWNYTKLKKKNFFNLYFVTIKYVTWEWDYNYVHNYLMGARRPSTYFIILSPTGLLRLWSAAFPSGQSCLLPPGRSRSRSPSVDRIHIELLKWLHEIALNKAPFITLSSNSQLWECSYWDNDLFPAGSQHSPSSPTKNNRGNAE